MQTLTEYEVEHLLITVGGNPLPCAVAAKLLLKPKGKVHLIYSTASAPTAARLYTALGADPKCAVTLESFERDSDEVYERVATYVAELPAGETVGLHYTGGTKVMSVHAHRAVRKVRPSAVASYLDSARLELLIERPGPSIDKPISLRDADVRKLVTLTLDELWVLHGIKLLPPDHKKNRMRLAPVFPQAARLIGELFSNGGRVEWFQKLQSGVTRLDALPFKVAEAILAVRPDLQTVAEVKQEIRGFRGTSWLQGDWLEDYTLGSLIAIADDVGIRPSTLASSIVTQRADGTEWFEVDAIAMRGHQIFIFSCTTSDKTDVCKEKLFEASYRAAQLGGDEARFALVCDHPNRAEVRAELDRVLPSERYQVFDRVNLADLGGALKEWIKRCS